MSFFLSGNIQRQRTDKNLRHFFLQQVQLLFSSGNGPDFIQPWILFPSCRTNSLPIPEDAPVTTAIFILSQPYPFVFFLCTFRIVFFFPPAVFPALPVWFLLLSPGLSPFLGEIRHFLPKPIRSVLPAFSKASRTNS